MNLDRKLAIEKLAKLFHGVPEKSGKFLAGGDQ